MDHSCLFFGGCKIVEVVFTGVCLVMNIFGLMAEEPLPLPYVWCSGYVLFTLISIATAAAFFITMKGTRDIKITISIVIATSVSSCFYFTMALMQMYELILDEHIDSMADDEEYYHEFFQTCVNQSVTDTAAALVFLIDAIIQVDVVRHNRLTASIRFQGLEGLHEVEIDPLDPIEFNCWLCSIPRWCRETHEHCSPWCRFRCFLRRMRSRRRRGEPESQSPSVHWKADNPQPGPSRQQQSTPRSSMKPITETKVDETVDGGADTVEHVPDTS